jgi:large subunit ribosomal protein L23
MALFGRSKKAAATETEAPVKAAKVAKPAKEKAVKKPKAEVMTTSSSHVSASNLSHVLLQARITEKASMHMADSVYVFNVSPRASKRDIIAAVRKFYSVTPRKVSIATVPSKTKRNARTGKTGTKTGGRKAYIYLKKGETITL